MSKVISSKRVITYRFYDIRNGVMSEQFDNLNEFIKAAEKQAEHQAQRYPEILVQCLAYHELEVEGFNLFTFSKKVKTKRTGTYIIYEVPLSGFGFVTLE